MFKMIKLELKRGCTSIGMLISLTMGIACMLYQLIPWINKFEKSKKMWQIYEEYTSFTRGGFYNLWFPSLLDAASIYYFYFVGIIAVLPFAASYYKDKKSGVIKNICTRIRKKTYIKAKYIATFITGGIAVTIPLIVDFLLVRLYIPYDYFCTDGTLMSAVTSWGEYMLDHPYIAAVLLLFAWFLWGGVLACIALTVSAFSENYFTIQLMPFFFMLILFYLPGFIPVKYSVVFPYFFLTIFGNSNPIIGIVISLVVATGLYVLFVTREAKRDIL
ncbi:MAG: hypothetical protein IJD02_02815 [Lachnospiraceae bacterium]|nr:hypothetical protein [Lachnospiraceae bacterium]